MSFSSEAALKEALITACTNAVKMVEEEVYEEFAGNLNQYYTEFTPAEYIRTGALYNSLERTGVQSSESGAFAEVFFKTPSYQNGLVPLQSGDYGYATWSGQKVLDTAMHGSHGGYVNGTAIWDDSMASLGGAAGIRAILIKALKAQGL